MKLLFKYTFHLVILACVSALFSGCEQDPKYRVYDYPVPVVESIYPTDGYVTTQVVITGTNFGDRAEAVKVFFGEAQSNKVLDCKNNRLVVEVPETAVTGNLSLQIYNKKVENIGHYTVLPTPRVITVTSDSEDGEGVADTGDKVTITGENFGTDPSDISVSFNGTPAEFELVDESTIVATTPADYQTGSVTVTIHGYTMTGGAMFNPNSKGDVTVLYLQNYKQPFVKLKTSMLKKTIDFSSISAVQQTILYVGRLLVQSGVNALGVDAVAAFNAVSIIDSYVLAPGDSLAASITTFSAQNLGAKEYDRIPKGLRKMLVIAEIYIILTAVVVLFCRHPLLGIFLKPNETEALRQGMSYLVPMASFYFISGITNTFQGYYRGIGHLMITLFATLVQIPIRVVISYALFGRLEIQAVAIGTTIGWACMVVFELLMYRRYGRVEALRKNDR